MAMWAARSGYADCLRLLVNAGLNLDARNPYGQTVAMGAASDGRVD